MFGNVYRVTKALGDTLRYIGDQLGTLKLIVAELSALNQTMRMRQHHAVVKVLGKTKHGEWVTFSKPCDHERDDGNVDFQLGWALMDASVRVEGDVFLVSVSYGQNNVLDGPALSTEVGNLTRPGDLLVCRWQRMATRARKGYEL